MAPSSDAREYDPVQMRMLDLRRRLDDQRNSVTVLSQYADLSDAVYTSRRGPKELEDRMHSAEYGGNLNDWSVATRDHAPLLTKECAIFYNSSTKEYVLATAGTASPRDVAVDAGLLLGKVDQARLQQAEQLLLQLGSPVDYFIGHSLGGQTSESLGLKHDVSYFSFNGPSFPQSVPESQRPLREKAAELGNYVVVENDVVGNAPSFFKPEGANVMRLPGGHGPVGNHSLLTIRQELNHAKKFVVHDIQRVDAKFTARFECAVGDSDLRYVAVQGRGFIVDSRCEALIDTTGKVVERDFTASLAPTTKDGLMAGAKSSLFDGMYNLLAPKDMKIPTKQLMKTASTACVKTWASANVDRFVDAGLSRDYGGIAAAGLVDVATGDYQAAFVSSLTAASNQLASDLGLRMAYSRNVVASSTGYWNGGKIISGVQDRHEANFIVSYAFTAGVHWSDVSYIYQKNGMVLEYKARGVGAHASVGKIVDVSAGLASGTECTIAPCVTVDGGVIHTHSRSRVFQHEFTLGVNVSGREVGGKLFTWKQVITDARRREHVDGTALVVGEWVTNEVTGFERAVDLMAVTEIDITTKKYFGFKTKKAHFREEELTFQERRDVADVVDVNDASGLTTTVGGHHTKAGTIVDRFDGRDNLVDRDVRTFMETDTKTTTVAKTDGSDLFENQATDDQRHGMAGKSKVHVKEQQDVTTQVKQGAQVDCFSEQRFSGFHAADYQRTKDAGSITTFHGKKSRREEAESLAVRFVFVSRQRDGRDRIAEEMSRRVFASTIQHTTADGSAYFSRNIGNREVQGVAGVLTGDTTIFVNCVQSFVHACASNNAAQVQASGEVQATGTFTTTVETTRSSACVTGVTGEDYGVCDSEMRTNVGGVASAKAYETTGDAKACEAPPAYVAPPKPEIPSDPRTNSENWTYEKVGGGQSWGKRNPRIYKVYFRGECVDEFTHKKHHDEALGKAQEYVEQQIQAAQREHSAKFSKSMEEWDRLNTECKREYEAAKLTYEQHRHELEKNRCASLQKELAALGFDQLDMNGATLTATHKVESEVVAVDLTAEKYRLTRKVDAKTKLANGATRSEADSELIWQRVKTTEQGSGEVNEINLRELRRYRVDQLTTNDGVITADFFGRVHLNNQETDADHFIVIKVYKEAKHTGTTVIPIHKVHTVTCTKGGYFVDSTTVETTTTKYNKEPNGAPVADDSILPDVSPPTTTQALNAGASRLTQSVVGGLVGLSLRKLTDATGVTLSDEIIDVGVSGVCAYVEGQATAACCALVKAGKMSKSMCIVCIIGGVAITSLVCNARDYLSTPPAISTEQDDGKKLRMLSEHWKRCWIKTSASFATNAFTCAAIAAESTTVAACVGFFSAPLMNVVRFVRTSSLGKAWSCPKCYVDQPPGTAICPICGGKQPDMTLVDLACDTARGLVAAVAGYCVTDALATPRDRLQTLTIFRQVGAIAGPSAASAVAVFVVQAVFDPQQLLRKGINYLIKWGSSVTRRGNSTK